MDASQKVNDISPEELLRWMEEETPFYLLHTLTAEHYEKVHLPRAVRASVFEVSFLDQVREATGDPETPIVLYGASARSRDADTAAGKLHIAGYRNIHVLKGGIETWRDRGLPLEGEAPEVPQDPQTLLIITDGTYRIVPEESAIQWIGRNPGTRHHGLVNLASGQLTARDGVIAGTFEIDMTSITNLNLAGDELQQVLEEHLKSDDFFFTRLFPTARFTLEKATPIAEPFLSTPNYDVQGKLELRGVTAPLAFKATVTRTENGGLAAEAHFDLNRTTWQVIYGSSRFFEHLGMHLVFDMISFELRIHGIKAGQKHCYP